jgi:hypothetical protein
MKEYEVLGRVITSLSFIKIFVAFNLPHVAAN